MATGPWGPPPCPPLHGAQRLSAAHSLADGGSPQAVRHGSFRRGGRGEGGGGALSPFDTRAASGGVGGQGPPPDNGSADGYAPDGYYMYSLEGATAVLERGELIWLQRRPFSRDASVRPLSPSFRAASVAATATLLGGGGGGNLSRAFVDLGVTDPKSLGEAAGTPMRRPPPTATLLPGAPSTPCMDAAASNGAGERAAGAAPLSSSPTPSALRPRPTARVLQRLEPAIVTNVG
jgi:hypothetical protein